MTAEADRDETVRGFALHAVDEIARLVTAIDAEALEAAAALLCRVPRVHLSGNGRSGLMAKAIAMRLMHIGLQSFVVGEIAAPGIQKDDLLTIVSASGRGTLLEQARTARDFGARVLAITADPDNPLAQEAQARIIVPARTEVATRQHAGSLFEQGVLITGDALCHSVQARLKVPTSELNRRHANLL
ncbi:6-phospho-3-hexuloisomerase [Sediminivirga luteola]|jgi:6-phospho-3-hexuloisomerase|uniref:6-phospho 3-hexuloisomerase n=1 Tax=Sediminivirga luteola TaxID=1774748 RepID=A0A8J2TZ24_9MICO|nr:6-phospho-3-hexuloisomerase [Sediminivirga luteola]MCI2265592.1 SIS domain-containing protein [Sediminivirga luteola]GGA18541.1 6-phospho 3-hexuloisomerase [Sediminivirga luteola]